MVYCAFVRVARQKVLPPLVIKKSNPLHAGGMLGTFMA